MSRRCCRVTAAPMYMSIPSKFYNLFHIYLLPSSRSNITKSVPPAKPVVLILTRIHDRDMLFYHCIHLCQFPLQLGDLCVLVGNLLLVLSDLLLVIDDLCILSGNQVFQFPIFRHNHSL